MIRVSFEVDGAPLDVAAKVRDMLDRAKLDAVSPCIEDLAAEPETIEVPVTRRARVTRIGRLRLARVYDVVAIATETGRTTLPPGTRFTLRPYEGAPFRSGLGVVREDLSLDTWGIPSAAHGDLLYRVEPP